MLQQTVLFVQGNPHPIHEAHHRQDVDVYGLAAHPREDQLPPASLINPVGKGVVGMQHRAALVAWGAAPLLFPNGWLVPRRGRVGDAAALAVGVTA